MDANSFFRILVGIVLVLGGLGYVGVRILGAISGMPDGPLLGWGPILAGLGVAAGGVFVLCLPLIFH